MARGDGRIFLRGNVYWTAYSLNGEEYRESAKTSDEKEARKFLRGRIREVGADQIGARTFTTPKASRLTVRDLIEALKADYELRGKANVKNISNLNRVTADLGERRAAALTGEAIDKYIKERIGEGDAPASINRSTQLLKQAYKLAAGNGHLPRMPRITHLSEEGNERKGFLSPVEFQKVLAALPDDLKDFAQWAYATGMRKGEAAKLTWSMVDGDELQIPKGITKNREARTIPLSPELADILKRRKALRPVAENGCVRMIETIFHRGGKPIVEFRKSWATACRTAAVAGTRFHDLRRSAARNLTQAGVPREIAKKVTGHVSDSMWERYNIVVVKDVREALEQTERYRKAAQQKVVSIAQ